MLASKHRKISRKRPGKMPRFLERISWESQFGLSTESLKSRPDLVAPVVNLYREIFGNDPVWREGAYCVKEGFEKHIPLAEYERLKEGDKAVCECGGKYVLCNPQGKVRDRLRELCSRDDGFVFAQMNRDGAPCGFTLGTCELLEKCIETVIHTRYRRREQAGRIMLAGLNEVLLEHGCCRNERLLYIEEVASAEDARSLEHAMLLSETALGYGLGRSNHALFWTTSDTAIFQLSMGVGFSPVFTTADGITFLLCRDVGNAVQILRSMSPRRYAVHCANILRRR